MKFLYVLGGILWMLFLSVSCHETDIDEIENSVSDDSIVDTYVFPVCNYKLYFKTEIEVLDTLQTFFDFGDNVKECKYRLRLSDSLELSTMIYTKSGELYSKSVKEAAKIQYARYYDFFRDFDSVTIGNRKYKTHLFAFKEKKIDLPKRYYMELDTKLKDSLVLSLTFIFEATQPKEIYTYENYVHELMEGLVKIE